MFKCMFCLLTISILIICCNATNVLTANGLFTKHHPHIYRRLQHYLYNMISNDVDVTVRPGIQRISRTYRILFENCLTSANDLQHYETFRKTITQYLCGYVGYTGLYDHMYIWKIYLDSSNTKMFIAFTYLNLPFKGTMCLRNNITFTYGYNSKTYCGRRLPYDIIIGRCFLLTYDCCDIHNTQPPGFIILYHAVQNTTLGMHHITLVSRGGNEPESTIVQQPYLKYETDHWFFWHIYTQPYFIISLSINEFAEQVLKLVRLDSFFIHDGPGMLSPRLSFKNTRRELDSTAFHIYIKAKMSLLRISYTMISGRAICKSRVYNRNSWKANVCCINATQEGSFGMKVKMGDTNFRCSITTSYHYSKDMQIYTYSKLFMRYFDFNENHEMKETSNYSFHCVYGGLFVYMVKGTDYSKKELIITRCQSDSFWQYHWKYFPLITTEYNNVHFELVITNGTVNSRYTWAQCLYTCHAISFMQQYHMM